MQQIKDSQLPGHKVVTSHQHAAPDDTQTRDPHQSQNKNCKEMQRHLDYASILLALTFAALLPPSRAASVELHAYEEAPQEATHNKTSLLGDTELLLERPVSWLKNAQEMMASPAGHVVVQMAKELLHRSAGNSQVLSLNLTNLLIIVLLKVLIFSAGMLGAGHWSSYGYGYGRSDGSQGRSDGSHTFGLLPGDDYLITGFLAAQGAGVDGCLYAAACASPTAAYEYAKAARALLVAVEAFDGVPLGKPRYNDLIVLLERAAYDGYRGESCNTSQSCDGLL